MPSDKPTEIREIEKMLRSEEMTLCQIFIPSEAAYFVISELGEIGTVQFRDLNKEITSFRRNFVNDVRRCHEMERKLRYIESEIESSGTSVTLCSEHVRVPDPNEITDLETRITKSEEEIKKLTQNADSLRRCSLELLELKSVLEKSEVVFRKRDEIFGFDVYRNSDELYSSVANQLNIVTVVINRERVKSFETMLWRISKGNVFFERVDIERPMEDLITGAQSYKTVFIICFHGQLLVTRINKICEGFHASLYSCPISPSERRKLLESVYRRLAEINLVINQTYSYRQNFLLRVATEVRHWSTMVSKIKAIYHVLNFLNMDITGKCFIGECWIPVRNLQMIRKALAEGSRASGCSVFSFLYVVKTHDEPPTYNITNKFTRCFQKLIDAYGIASYEETNAAMFSMITFPFFFAVMFGDMGHAIILVLFGPLLVQIGEKKISNEIFNLFYAGRYLILLMGVFSFYTGFIYNDIFSKSFNIFGSSWYLDLNQTRLFWDHRIHLRYRGTPYFFGIDPAWEAASNRIVFLNSYKMKMSIIFGVLHMIMGLFLNVVNYIHFKKYVNIFLEFIPQLVILCCLFLWLVAMMFIKWILYTSSSKDVKYGSSCAPSILISFINMLLLKETRPRSGCEPNFFQFQPKLQNILLIICTVGISVLLLGKPLYLIYVRRDYSNSKDKNMGDDLSLRFRRHEEVEDSEETISDLFIIQGISTIEYVLSTISHAASYLRLWALSLAHSELSAVLWSRLLCSGLKFPGFGGGFALFASFLLWSLFTLIVLVVMEGLSAFLHTLRLHWVEFMSKFYSGRGYPFEPFSFKEILEHIKDRDESDEDDF